MFSIMFYFLRYVGLCFRVLVVCIHLLFGSRHAQKFEAGVVLKGLQG